MQLTRAFAATAAAVALAAPAAHARIDPPPTSAFNASEPESAPVVVVRSDMGFDWGAAAIGAGGAGALVALASLSASRRRTRAVLGAKE
jgi:hypothetical protein